jgi:hypothetical protein
MRYFLLSSFWILVVFFAVKCASTPPEPLNLNWEFVENPVGTFKACLSESDVSKIKAALDRCNYNGE